MKTRHEIELRQSEIREALNAPEAPANETELRTELRALETEYRDAIKAEQEAERKRQAALGGDPDASDDGEGAEFRALVDKVELRAYLQAAATGQSIAGAEQELAQAAKLDGGAAGTLIPWEVLDPGTELRAEAVEDRAATPAPAVKGRDQQTIIGRVFARTGAAHLGVRMPTVGVGEPVYVYLSGGNSPGFVDKGGTANETAGSFGTRTFSPKRLTAAYRVAVEDLAVLKGMEAALRNDLRSALGEVLDRVIVGAGGAQVRGMLATAANGGLADVTDPTDVVSTTVVDATLIAPIDGKHATEEGEIRYLIGAETYRTLFGIYDANSGERVFDRYKARSRVSAHIPAKDGTTKVQQGVAVTQRGPIMVAPVWQGVQIIRDPYSAADDGEVILTAVMLANFGIVRSDGASRLKFKLEA